MPIITSFSSGSGGSYTFGWTPADVTSDTAGNIVSNVPLTVWTTAARTEQVTDLFDADGVTPLGGGVVHSDATGRYGFVASDAFTVLYVWSGSGAAWPVLAHEVLDSAASRSAEAVASASAAEGNAAAAQAAAESAASDAAAQTSASLSSTFVPQWKPSTDYAAGALVSSPTGDVVTAKAAFTSGTTYDPTKWVLSPGRAAGTFGKVLCLGTSITFGTGATTTANNYVSLLPDKMRPLLQGIQPVIVNGGKAGDSQGQMFVRLRALLEAERPTYVVIETSINDTRDDLGITPDTTITNLRAAVGMTRLFGAVPVVLTSAPISPATFGAPYSAASLTRQSQTNALVKTEMAKIGVQVVDMFAIYGGSPQNLADGIHPNNTGHDQWATIIGNALTGRALPSYQPDISADTFTRADGSALGATEVGAKTWQAPNSTTWVISGNTLNSGSGAGATAPNDCLVDDGSADGILYLTRLGNSSSSGLAFRVSADGLTGYLVYRSGSNYLLAKRTTATAYTTLVTSSGITPAAGDVVKVELNGSTIKASINGVQFAAITDASYAGTRHGAWTNLGVLSTFDSWKHSPLPAA